MPMRVAPVSAGGGGYSTVKKNGVTIGTGNALNLLPHIQYAEDDAGNSRTIWRLNDPDKLYDMHDDFTGGLTTNANIGKMGWSLMSGTAAQSTATPGTNEVGAIQITAPSNSFAHISTNAAFYLNGPFELTAKLAPVNPDSFSATWFGFINTTSFSTFTNGIIIGRPAVGVNWQVLHRNASVDTGADSGKLVDPNTWATARLRKLSASNNDMNITFNEAVAGGVPVSYSAVSPANIPMYLFFYVDCQTALVTRTLHIEYIELQLRGITR